MRSQLFTLLLSGAALGASAQCTVTITKSAGTTPRTYTASSGATGMAYSWTTQATPTAGTGTSIQRYYPYGGVYSVKVVGIKTGTAPCTDSLTLIDSVVGAINCSAASTSISANANGMTGSFTVTNNANVPPNYTATTTIYYGDGSSGTSASHTYAQPGTYTVTDTTVWTSTGNYTACKKSGSTSITVTAPIVTGIYGNIYWDSTLATTYVPSVKVWLIRYDSSAQTLTAVDSVTGTTNMGLARASYIFPNAVSGNYRLKAHITNQPAATVNGLVPTYADSAIVWSAAAQVSHTTGGSTIKSWNLRHGTPVTGSGFVGGSVLQGANKNTATGDPIGGMWVYLMDVNKKLVRSAVTDAQGNYSFSDVPVGNYTVQPEEMNYTTTNSAVFPITGFQNQKTGVNFRKNTSARTIVPANTAGVGSMNTVGYVQISPNPSTGVFEVTIPATDGKIRLSARSMTGQLVYESTIEATPAGNGIEPVGTLTTVDLSKLPSGIYSLEIAMAQHTDRLLLSVIR